LQRTQFTRQWHSRREKTGEEKIPSLVRSTKERSEEDGMQMKQVIRKVRCFRPTGDRERDEKHGERVDVSTPFPAFLCLAPIPHRCARVPAQDLVRVKREQRKMLSHKKRKT